MGDILVPARHQLSAAHVSVVIAAYNAAHTLAHAVASAANQSVPPDEIIVVDDGSTDGTADTIEPGSVSAFIRQRNQGPAQARNAGVRAARGEWIAFLDADDLWHPTKLEEQLRFATAHPEAVIVACDWVRSETLLSPHATAAPAWYGYRDLVILNRFQTSTVLMRRDVLTEIHGFDPRLDGVEDWDCWLRASLHGPIALVHAPLVVYRDNPEGVSKDLRRLREGALRIMRRERERGVLHPRDAELIFAWHLQRLVVAELLARDAVGALGALWSLRLAAPRSHYQALNSLLIPFLRTRARRRRDLASA